jgi:hypothetical protein
MTAAPAGAENDLVHCGLFHDVKILQSVTSGNLFRRQKNYLGNMSGFMTFLVPLYVYIIA